MTDYDRHLYFFQLKDRLSYGLTLAFFRAKVKIIIIDSGIENVQAPKNIYVGSQVNETSADKQKTTGCSRLVPLQHVGLFIVRGGSFVLLTWRLIKQYGRRIPFHLISASHEK